MRRETRFAAILVRLSVIAGVTFFAAAGVSAQSTQPDASEKGGGFQAYPNEPAVTHDTVTVGDQKLHYQARAGTITLVSDRKHKPRAKIFYMAYRKTAGPEGAVVGGDRPITFCFNGGPGSASVWLHLGLFGPRRVQYANDKGDPGPPPHTVTENHHSLLNKTDLVFIDPVSTGYSRPEGDTNAKRFHGLQPDIASVATFIRRYLTEHERWASPKFIAGESYGTTRAAGLARYMSEDMGIAVNGLVLVSPVLHFQTIRTGGINNLPYILALPSYAATAHYHGELSDQLQDQPVAEVRKQAEEFAMGRYSRALRLGHRMPESMRQDVLDELSRLTGLDRGYLDRANLRVPVSRFAKELLREDGEVVGRFDARFAGLEEDRVDDRYEYDASFAALRSNFTQSFNAYIRRGLEFKSDLKYEVMADVRPWEFGRAGRNRYLDMGEALRKTMHRQPHMRVFIAAGYYDLATPYFAAEHTLAQLELAKPMRQHITLHGYPAGHMMYVHEPSLKALSSDLERFYASVPVAGQNE